MQKLDEKYERVFEKIDRIKMEQRANLQFEVVDKKITKAEKTKAFLEQQEVELEEKEY